MGSEQTATPELWCDHVLAERIGGHAIYCTTCGGSTVIRHAAGWACNDPGRPDAGMLGHGIIECPACGRRASLDKDDPRRRSAR